MKEYILVYETFRHAVYGYQNAVHSLNNLIQKASKPYLTIDIFDETYGELRLRFVPEHHYETKRKEGFRGSALNGYFFDKQVDRYYAKNNIAKL